MKTYLNRLLHLHVWILGVSLFYTPVQAQFVTIPDTNFVSILKLNGYAGCFDSINKMDTTCQAILRVKYLNLSYMRVSNFSGIQYFKNLDSLRLNADTSLSYIPALPPHLKVFESRNNFLDSLPPLPDSLQRLVCDFNSLSTLPVLPSSLLSLSCINNHLSALPVLPDALQVLFCSGNQLTSLPDTLPSALTMLSCYSNKLSALPALPASLQQLLCSSNTIGSLPALPSTLLNLSCYANQLGALPALPASLSTLSCNNNNLTSLPALPHSLTGLNCENNNLGSLPDLPDSMSTLFCDNNPGLLCLPLIKTIGDLEFYNTGITCTPDYGNVASSNPALSTLPLCDVGNEHGCLVLSDIGQVKSIYLNIYPNPAAREVWITTNEASGSLIISDLSGREMLRQAIISPYFQLSVEQIPAGIYLLRITDGQDKTGCLKLAIE